MSQLLKLEADMFSISRQTCNFHRGFSLVELMVAMVIGLLGVIVIMQVFSLSESRKRTTTGGNDAMTEGVMSLYAIQRDIGMAGYGIGDTKVLGCNMLLRAGVTLNAMAPVTINHASITGQDANTDTLLVVYGNSNGTPQGDSITSTGNVVQTPSSFTVNDMVVNAPAVRANVCNLTLDQIANVAGGVVTLSSGSAMTNGSTLFNLGQAFKVVAYAIRGGNLTMCDYIANNCGSAANNGSTAVWVPIANNIVSMRAQYGRDTTAPMNGIVDIYDQTTPAPAAATTACDWARTSAIRMALVARSAQFEKVDTTTGSPIYATAAAPVWEGSIANNPTGSAATTINLTQNPAGSANADWRNYRYKVFQTVVPVRNISWMGVVSGC
jgi:type IV pilus assembly protein PilW